MSESEDKHTLTSDPHAAQAAHQKFDRVQITDREHPHFEEYGRFTGKVIHPIWAKKHDGSKDMAEVKLENCQHGSDGCFVSRGQVTKVAER